MHTQTADKLIRYLDKIVYTYILLLSPKNNDRGHQSLSSVNLDLNP